jgi:hypothetical protein
VDATGNPILMQLNFSNVDLTGGNGANTNLYPVQPGDYIEIQRCGLVHLITSVTSTGATSSTVTLASPVPQAITTATTVFRIIRAPRVVGEEPLDMPNNIAIDLNTNGTYSNPLPGGSGGIDILFSPSGAVLSNTGSDRLILWVRDITLPNVTDGAPTLIVTYLRSGLIASYQVNPNGANPYSFVP